MYGVNVDCRSGTQSLFHDVRRCSEVRNGEFVNNINWSREMQISTSPLLIYKGTTKSLSWLTISPTLLLRLLAHRQIQDKEACNENQGPANNITRDRIMEK